MKKAASKVRAGNESNGHNGHSILVGVHANGTAKNGATPVNQQPRELISHILALTRQLLAVDDSAADLPLRQLRVCMVLHEGPRSMSYLSRELGVSLSAMTQIADRLERAKLVKRQFEGADRRVRSLQLTPRGLKIMQAREDARIQRAKVAFDRIPEKSQDGILDALKELRQACQTTADQNHGFEIVDGSNDEHQTQSLKSDVAT